jgi:2'-5' RNA ligase
MPERMFLAVALDDETRIAVAARLDDALEGSRLPGRVTPIENWHITLRFLGSTSQVQAEQILAHLDDHLAVDPFRLTFTRLGAFPRERKASVLWLGCDGDVESLGSVAEECEHAAERAGFEPEGRPFHAHLTLARIRPPMDVRDLVDAVEPLRVPMVVNEVTLYRSILGGGPARYEVVDSVALGE